MVVPNIPKWNSKKVEELSSKNYLDPGPLLSLSAIRSVCVNLWITGLKYSERPFITWVGWVLAICTASLIWFWTKTQFHLCINCHKGGRSQYNLLHVWNDLLLPLRCHILVGGNPHLWVIMGTLWWHLPIKYCMWKNEKFIWIFCQHLLKLSSAIT